MRPWLLMLSFALALPVQAEDKVVNLYSWADYVSPQTLQRFERETGYQVRYDTFDTPEVLETKLLMAASGYDVVVPSSSVLARLLKAGALQPTGQQGMPGYGNLDPDLLGKVAAVDPGNRYALPYTWGTLGLGVNLEAVRKRLPDAPLDSLDLLFKPEYASQLADCGISLIDSPQEVIGLALHYLGKDPYSTDKADLDAAAALLHRLQPYVSYVANGRQINDLAIPKDAPHPEAARAFIAFMLRPESVADLTNTLFFANANQQATPLVDEAVRNDPDIYPGAPMRQRLYADQSMSLAAMRQRTRLWTAFRSREQ